MPDLHLFTLDELLALKEDVEDAILRLQAEQREMARKEIQAIAAAHGVSLDELLVNTSSKPKAGNGQKPVKLGIPKYRNPYNHAQTWTGKGKRPGWFMAAQAGGTAPESMLI